MLCPAAVSSNLNNNQLYITVVPKLTLCPLYKTGIKLNPKTAEIHEKTDHSHSPDVFKFSFAREVMLVERQISEGVHAYCP